MKQTANVEKIADEFLRGYLRQNPGLELVSVQCHVDTKALAQAATHDDVTKFLETLPRYEVDDVEVPDELVHAQPEPEVDIDQSEPERLILARKLHHHLTYYAGLHRTGRVLWVKDARLAKVFGCESDVLTEVFQFRGAQEDMLVLKDIFKDLNLQMLVAPRLES